MSAGTVIVAGRAGEGTASEVGALVASVTATDPMGPGFVTLYPSGAPLPWASNVNVERAGQTIANQVTVGTGTSDSVDLYTQSGTNLALDVFGWYTS